MPPIGVAHVQDHGEGYMVYILRSGRDGKLSTGDTSTLHRRLWRYNHGFVASTRHRRPLTVIDGEPCADLRTARVRERQLKRGKSRLQEQRLVDHGQSTVPSWWA